ncbi:conserved hypothetical protein [Gammaproteobacteria bacterium]
MKEHLHLLIDATVANPPKSAEEAKAWLDNLVTEVGMEKLGGPWAVYCDDPENRGLTGQVWLTTSHSCFHFWDNCPTPFAKFDIYSCRHFDIGKVVRLFDEAFNIVNGSWTFINRNDATAHPEITQGTIR